MRKFLVSAAALAAVFVVAATSCSKEGADMRKDRTISFKAGELADLSTKSADGAIRLESQDPDAPCLYVTSVPYAAGPAVKSVAITTDNFSSVCGTFSVNAFVAGKSDRYLNGASVNYNAESNSWDLKDSAGNPYYWARNDEDTGYEEMMFWAMACQNGSAFTETACGGDSYAFQYNNFIAGQTAPYTKDLIIAYKRQNVGDVDLKFRHALAAVGAYIDPEQDPQTEILNCSFNNINTKGSCTVAPSGESIAFAWDSNTPGSYAAAFDGSAEAISRDNMHFIIPQTLGDDATVTITVRRDGVSKTHTYSLKGTAYEAGRRYIYKLGYPTGAILLNGPDFWAKIKALVPERSVESVDFLVDTPLSSYDSTWPSCQVHDPALSKAKIYAVYDASTKALHIVTNAFEMYSNVSMENMFKGYDTKSSPESAQDGPFAVLKSVTFGPLKTEKTTSMKYLFNYCTSLTSVDLASLNTANVTDFERMFLNCNKMAVIDVSTFDTRKAVNLNAMFDTCASMEEFKCNPETFKTDNVYSLAYMFHGCLNLKKADVSHFNTSKVTVYNSMFAACISLPSIDVSNFDFSKAIIVNNMFHQCYKATDIKLPADISFPNVTNTSFMFCGCYSLRELDLSAMVAAKNTSTQCMFQDCYSVKTIKIPNLQTSNVTNAAYMFQCQGKAKDEAGNKLVSILESIQIDPAKFTFDQCTTMEHMFDNCRSLKSMDVTGFKTGNVTDMSYMFYLCEALDTLDVSKFDTGNVTNMERLFFNCKKLPAIDVSRWDTGKVTDVTSMFDGCSIVTELDVNNFKTSNILYFKKMFNSCVSLKSITCSSATWNTEKAKDLSYMFSSCSALESVDIECFRVPVATTLTFMFNGCQKLTTLKISSDLNTANVTDMDRMFNDCQALSSVNLTGFNTAKVTNMQQMFMNCYALTSLDLSGFDTSKVTNMYRMLYSTSGLKTLKFSSSFNCNVSGVTMTEFMSYCGGNNSSSSKGSLYCSDAAWTALTANSSITKIDTEKWEHVSL